MRTQHRFQAGPVIAASAVSLLLTGCAQSGRAGEPMMGGPTAVHYAPVSCGAPVMPGSVVQVRLADMGMTQMMGGTAPMGARMTLDASPVAIKAGVVTFVASNQGWRTHELIVLPLTGSAGQRSPGPDGKVSESSILGESSRPCAADAGTGLTSGSTGWTTVTLAAGRYELMCNLPNHYADGMRQEFTVT